MLDTQGHSLDSSHAYLLPRQPETTSGLGPYHIQQPFTSGLSHDTSFSPRHEVAQVL